MRSWSRRSASETHGLARLFVAVLVAVLLIGAGSARAETRIALVIGNGGYRTIEPLRNPVNDASDVSAALKALGFTVSTGIDLDRAAMQDAIAAFKKAATEADVALFYYSGHGLAVDEQNYIIPVDAVLQRKADVKTWGVALSDIVRLQTKPGGQRLVFLDACRNNPLPRDQVEGPAGGLVRVGELAGSMIVFATQPNNVAYDGAGRNSPFTEALLGHITTVGEDISGVMIKTRNDVIAATGSAQVPFEDSSLTRRIYLAPGEAPSESPETMLFRLAAAQKDANLLKIYLDRFPEGPHVKDVRGLLDSPEVKQGATQPAGDASQDVEGLLWDLARSGRIRALVDLYIARYPDGTHAEEARALALTLPSDDTKGEPAGVVCEKLATHPRDATANTAGVDFDTLSRNAEAAVAACSEARAQNPEVVHYVALLARAMIAAGRRDEAIALYREAAERGDARAMVSLGLLMTTGQGVPTDLEGAAALYAKAADRGSADGAINLAVALMGGRGVERDTDKAIALLRKASESGSAIAAYNLGVLHEQGVAGDPKNALDLFLQATRRGDPRGYLAAAILLDEGRGVEKDPERAADMLLRGVTADSGEAYNELTSKAASWSSDTIRAVQKRLKGAGYFKGSVNGRAGAALGPALKQWRLLGPRQEG